MNGRRATTKEHEYIKKVLNVHEAKASNVSKIILPIICIAIVFVIVVQIGSNTGANVSPLIGCLVLFGGMAIIVSGNAKEKNSINRKKYTIYEGFACDYVPYQFMENINALARKKHDIEISNARIRFVYNENPNKEINMEMPYKSCTESVIYSSFPALLIVLEDGNMYAIPDWEKINHDDNYIEMRNRGWTKYN